MSCRASPLIPCVLAHRVDHDTAPVNGLLAQAVLAQMPYMSASAATSAFHSLIAINALNAQPAQQLADVLAVIAPAMSGADLAQVGCCLRLLQGFVCQLCSVVQDVVKCRALNQVPRWAMRPLLMHQ